uniref:Uncharacterized protein n=1 Tax=Avena sativa TaxID=4498 RepID=A0ACD5UMR4_AVESA
MSRVVSFVIPILETLAAQFALPALLYLCEVAEDGSVLAGVEIELPMDAVVMVPRRKFFWCASRRECLDAYDQASLQAIAFLQRMYGFVVSDYNYGCMMSYRDSMYSVVVLVACAARRVGRLERELLRALSPVSLPSESPSSLDWYLMSSRLLASVRYI